MQVSSAKNPFRRCWHESATLDEGIERREDLVAAVKASERLGYLAGPDPEARFVPVSYTHLTLPTKA